MCNRFELTFFVGTHIKVSAVVIFRHAVCPPCQSGCFFFFFKAAAPLGERGAGRVFVGFLTSTGGELQGAEGSAFFCRARKRRTGLFRFPATSDGAYGVC